MASGEESFSAADDRHDFTRDPDAPVDEAAANLTSAARKHIRSIFVWLCVWIVIYTLLLGVLLVTGIFDLFRSPTFEAVGTLIGAPLIAAGLPLCLLVFTARAYRRSMRGDDLQQLAIAFRIQHWAMVIPVVIGVVIVLAGLLLLLLSMFGIRLGGIQFNG